MDSGKELNSKSFSLEPRDNRGIFNSTQIGFEDPKQKKISKYTRKEMTETLKGMNYNKLFLAQSNLSEFNKKFNADTHDPIEKITIIKDVLGYLDQDLTEVFKK